MKSGRLFPLYLFPPFLLTVAFHAGAQTLPSTRNPRVVLTAVPNSSYANMGLGFLSDGRMLMLTAATNTGNGALGFGDITPPDGNQALYLVDGLSAKGDLAGVTAVKILDSLTGPPPGVVVVNDTVYVQDRTAFYRVVSLTPKNGTAKSKNAVRILGAPTPDSTFTWTRGESAHQFVFTPLYHEGRFYAPYSGTIGDGGISIAPPTSTLTGAMLSWAKDDILPAGTPNAGFKREAGGLRSPNGMSSNGEYMVFTENQGGFNPGNAIRLFKPGQELRTYGTRQGTPANYGPGASNTLRNWAEDLPYDPPLIWLPHVGTLARSLSQPLYLDHGPYRGHWIVGDVTVPGMGRFFIDDVDSSGKYQASWQFLTGGVNDGNGTSAGRAINRLAMSPDSAVYIGTVLGLGAWPIGAAGPVTRMTFRDTAVFEILTVRSRKSADGAGNGVEVFFSEAVNPATVTTSAVELLQHDYLLGGDYGCYNEALCATKIPTVTSVSLSDDNRRAFVGIATPDTSLGASHIGTRGVGGNPLGVWGGPGKQDRTLRVTLKGVTSADGKSPLYHVAWMGWNYQAETRFDPSKNATSLTGGRARTPARLVSAFTVRVAGGRLEIRLEGQKPAEAALYDMNGALRARASGAGRIDLDARALGRGLHVLRVKQGGVVHARAVLLP